MTELIGIFCNFTKASKISVFKCYSRWYVEVAAGIQIVDSIYSLNTGDIYSYAQKSLMQGMRTQYFGGLKIGFLG